MSLYSKQFLLSPVKSENTTKSLTNKLVSLPPETFSSTSTSPNYGISSDTSIGKTKLITLINPNTSKIGGHSIHKQKKVNKIVENFEAVVSNTPCKTDIRTTKHYIEDEDSSVYCLSDVSSLDLKSKDEEDSG